MCQKRLRETKALREQVKDDNYHKEQSKSIPSLIDNSIHGIHPAPCYKKNTPLFLVKTPTILHQLLKNVVQIEFHRHPQKILDFYYTPKVNKKGE